MFTPVSKIRNARDVRALEDVPLEDRMVFDNVYQALAAAAEADPDHPALSYISDMDPATDPVTWSRADFFGRVTQAANLFHDTGLGPTDVVAFLLPALAETHVVLWGTETAAIAAPVNYLLTPETIADLLKASKAKALVALGPHPAFDIWERAVAAAALAPDVVHLWQVCVDGNAPAPEAPDFMAEISRQPSDQLQSGRIFDKSDIAALFHTGGTTGVPKLAQHDHQGQLFAAWSAVQMNYIEPGNVVPGIYPLFHVAGALVNGLALLVGGGHIIIPTATGARNPQVIAGFWTLIERFGMTSFSGVPTILTALVACPLDADISSMAYARTGAAPMAAETAKAFEKLTGLKIHETLGMTETSGLISITPRFAERVQGSAGYTLPYASTSIREFQGEDQPPGPECPAGVDGMVLYKGPNVFPGYTDPARNEGVLLEGGWLVTGDLGNLDAEGHVTITGRAKDVIIRSGHNIDPVVLEAVADKHPAVRSSVAVGQPDVYAGEVPVLFVVLKPGMSATDDELATWVSDNIDEPPARPRRVWILDELPLTGVGKIYKPTLRARATEIACRDVLQHLQTGNIRIDLTAEPTKASGMVVSVQVSGVPAGMDRARLEQQIVEGLGGFSVSTKIVFS
jgi:fatty-acyl-CoA synthase